MTLTNARSGARLGVEVGLRSVGRADRHVGRLGAKFDAHVTSDENADAFAPHHVDRLVEGR